MNGLWTSGSWEGQPLHIPLAYIDPGSGRLIIHVAYIDPGSGSLIIQVAIAAIVSIPIFFRAQIARAVGMFRHRSKQTDAAASDESTDSSESG